MRENVNDQLTSVIQRSINCFLILVCVKVGFTEFWTKVLAFYPMLKKARSMMKSVLIIIFNP